MKKQVIMTDCDGVLLQWLAHTPSFIEDLGYDSSHLRDVMSGNKFVPFCDVFCTEDRKEGLERLRRYNESHYMRSLPIIENGSDEVIKRLSQKFDIVVVTSFSDKKEAYHNRLSNLELHFGDSISELICLKHEEDKTPTLKSYAKNRDVVLWVDDQIKHVHHGIEAGINSFQYTHGMSCGRNTGEVKEIDSWKKIEELMLKNKLKVENKRNRRKF